MADEQNWIDGHPAPVILGGDEQFWVDGHPILQPATNTLRSGSILISRPSVSGSGTSVGPSTTGTGAITIGAPAVSGDGFSGFPFTNITQYPLEDLEFSDAEFNRLTQLAVEDFETLINTGPQLNRLTQYSVEDLEQYNPTVKLTQYVVEILIPFDCDLTPPLTLPPGCPPDEIEGEGSNSAGCVDSPATGSGTSKAGCKPTFRN